MGVNVGLLAEYDRIFPEGNEIVDQLASGISNAYLIKSATYFLAYDLFDNKSTHWLPVVNFWFSEPNIAFAQEVANRIDQHYGDESDSLHFLSTIASLKLLQYGIQKVNDNIVKSKEQIEIDLFKIYLLLTQSYTKQHEKSKPIIEEKYGQISLGLTLLNMGFSTSDLLNYTLGREYYCQSVKALYLFKFIISEQRLQPHLQKFLVKYGINSIEDYYTGVMPFIQAIGKKKEEGFIQIHIDHNEEYEKHKFFIEKLSVQEYSLEDDVDFRLVRSMPLVKVEADTYRMTHPLFFTDKLYKSLYFEFSKINDSLPAAESIPGFRSFYTTNFSEKVLFYKVMAYCLKNRYLKLTGQELDAIGVVGSPDYYIRDGKTIFLFENKDILINAAVKETADFEKLEQEFAKKFLVENGRPVGVGQIINNVEKVLLLQNGFDNGYKPEKVAIYPVLVVHDIVYDCPGLNALLNWWFLEELKQVSAKGIDTSNVRPLTVLGIDSLIRIAQVLHTGNIQLKKLLDTCIEQTQLQKRTFRDEQEMKNLLTKVYLPSSKVIESLVFERFKVLGENNKILDHAFAELKAGT